jgi:acetyl esterase
LFVPKEKFTFMPIPSFMSANPSHIAKKIRELGNGYSPEILQETVRIYLPLLARAPRNSAKVTRNVPYGPDERHRLDVYTPANKSDMPLPILIFVHGGGFTSGHKREYSSIGYYFARHGILTVIPNYRLAPENKWPAGPEDIASILKWIGLHGSRFGGDTDRVFLIGHSAGAAHISGYMFFEDFQLGDGDGVIGAILMSGPTYDTTQLSKADMAYYGEDKSKHSSMSVIHHIDGCKIPLFIVFAEFDTTVVHDQNHILINALFERDRVLPIVKGLMGHNHFSGIMHINTRDESIGPDILEFIKILSSSKP